MAAPNLFLRTLKAVGVRNLAPLQLEPAPKFNVFAGDNGQGKTNVLEAVYLLATSKSFRTSRLGELVAFGQEVAFVRGRLRDGDDARAQSLGLRGAARAPRIDGKRPRSLFDYAVRSPVVVFHPGEVALSMGPSAERRRLLDRVALHLEPGLLSDLESYRRALRERQRALETRGATARDLPEWEALTAEHGLRVAAGRARAAGELGGHARDGFRRIGAPGMGLELSYQRSAPEERGAYLAALAASRARDLSRGSASVGPHRDDLALALDGRVAKGVASQGQHRAIVLALKSAEIEVVARARGVRPILLLDDVSSELDATRTAALFRFLRAHEGQVLLTTTRPDLIAVGEAGSRKDFLVDRGRVTGA